MFERVRKMVATWVGGSTLKDPTAEFLQAIIGMQATASGEAVTPESALSLSAYYACLRNISEDIGKLPFKVYAWSDASREPLPNDPIGSLIGISASEEMSAATWRETLIKDALAWGNGYSEIRRNGAGQPVGLYVIHPSRVEVKRDAEGAITYLVKNPGGLKSEIKSADILHVRGVGDDLVGYSVLTHARESLGLSLAAQKMGSAFFGNGAHLGGVLEHPGKISLEARKVIEESWKAQYSGPNATAGTALLQEGMVYKPLSIPPEDAQFLETREFQVEEVCRWFRMPPHKVGHLKRAQGWSTLEATNIDYVTDTLTPWAIRLEQEIDRKLLDLDRYSKIVFSALMRGDSAARAAFYVALFNMGVLSPNDIRKLEDMSPIENGDRHYVQLNMAELNSKSQGDTENDSARTAGTAQQQN